MSTKRSKVLYILLPIALSMITSILVFTALMSTDLPSNLQKISEEQVKETEPANRKPFPDFYAKHVSLMANDSLPNFVGAAEYTTKCVVHIRSKSTVSYQQSHPFMDDPMFRYFFGDEFSNPQEYENEATGSGVILSDSGYIVTNHHVIEGATSLTVTTWNNVEYDATLIGSDPDTDLALLKVKADNLPSIAIGNSDSVRIGEWVLAVGNPFNLSSTVTAGIVSAKSRNINIGSAQTSVESFIQTDAAVNPGNSGGALVNAQGLLIGINTAIASPTGSYAGYSFAVPSNLMYKVVKDLKDFGIVQRGFLGVSIQDISKELDLDITMGAYVAEIVEGGAADKAGIKQGDVIIEVENRPIQSSAELQERIASYRPGDEVTVKIWRDGKSLDKTIVLRNKDNETSLMAKESEKIDDLGISVAVLNNEELEEYNLEFGVKITHVHPGVISEATDIRKDFAVTKVNDTPIKSVDDFKKEIKKATGRVLLEGKYKDSERTYLKAFTFR